MKSSSFRSFWSVCLGNFFEHYDVALFGFLSPFLAPLIFPKQEPISALILTYAMMPIGIVARPLGSLVFGYLGDRYGRRHALFLTLTGMSLVTFVTACAPTYAQAGALAPVLFCLCRGLQNFCAAGETIGGAILLLENNKASKRDLLSGLYDSLGMLGVFLASLGVLYLSQSGVIETHWRLLYFLGMVTGLFGLIIRRQNLQEPSTRPSERMSFKLFWTYRQPLLIMMLAAGFGYASYVMALVLINGLVPFATPFSKAQMMSVNTALLVFDICMLPCFGWLAGKVSRERLMMGAAIVAAVLGVPLLGLLTTATFTGVIAIRVCLVLIGVAFFAPFHAWAQSLIPIHHRYVVISFGYAVGSQLFGGGTAAIALWCYRYTGHVSSAAIYWALLALVACGSIAWSLKYKQVEEVV